MPMGWAEDSLSHHKFPPHHRPTELSNQQISFAGMSAPPIPSTVPSQHLDLPPIPSHPQPTKQSVPQIFPARHMPLPPVRLCFLHK